VGGVGNGVLEISEDLVGFESLAYLQADDPGLFAELFRRIGDLMAGIWRASWYSTPIPLPSAGSAMTWASRRARSSPRVSSGSTSSHSTGGSSNLIHVADRPFLWHSCGCIFSVMDDVIGLGIQAKHSNEDCIAAYEQWIERYGDRIGLLGGIDLDILCVKTPDEVCKLVLERGTKVPRLALGYALGSGNSIPDYVPVEVYLAMIRAAQAIRADEWN